MPSVVQVGDRADSKTSSSADSQTYRPTEQPDQTSERGAEQSPDRPVVVPLLHSCSAIGVFGKHRVGIDADATLTDPAA